MKILYVANHGSGDNDDEGGIAHALEVLGHAVTSVHEKRRHRPPGTDLRALGQSHDWCLFHKWPTVSEIQSVACPKAFWYFDMVKSVEGDPTLRARSLSRIQWMADVVPLCRVAFCTDGDWVECYNSGNRTDKLRWLMQGADERRAGFGTSPPGLYPPVLFTGMVNHGQRRADHVARLRARYGHEFHVLGDAGPRYRKHGRELADVFAGVEVVVAPDGPCTDRYWSNRVYLTASLGGLLLHPRCEGLTTQYAPGIDLHYYVGREHLEALIDWYRDRPEERKRMAQAGYDRTMAAHTYRHRVEEIVRVMGGRP